MAVCGGQHETKFDSSLKLSRTKSFTHRWRRPKKHNDDGASLHTYETKRDAATCVLKLVVKLTDG